MKTKKKPAVKKIELSRKPTNPQRTSKAFEAKCGELRKLLGESVDNGDVLYRVGTVVAELMSKNNAEKYGKKAVERAASELNYTAGYLYEFAAVADAFPRASFDALMKRKNANGVRLSFSHFVQFAKMPAAERHDLIEKTLAEGWSANEVRKNRPKKPGGRTWSFERARATAKAASERLADSGQWLVGASLDEVDAESLTAARGVYENIVTCATTICSRLDNVLSSRVPNVRVHSEDQSGDIEQDADEVDAESEELEASEG